MKRILSLLLAIVCCHGIQAQTIDLGRTEPLSPYVFGHNLEHTRGAISGGLSAQMLLNRKFAGKPSRNGGVAADWEGIGEKVFFTLGAPAYTKHICLPNMRRRNELNSQTVQNLVDGQTAGILQKGLYLSEGCEYIIRTVTRTSAPVTLTVSLTDRSGEKVYAVHTLRLAPSEDWVENEFRMTPAGSDDEASVRYTFTQRAELTIGALSMMPSENFHGMRPDVVACLKEIGPRLIRWPGGNFAGEYRWKDGLLPVDMRGPQQSASEIHTHPFTHGYDYHEIDTDSFIALCREVGAEPMLTVNMAWNSPEESAEWVEYCNGPADSEYGRIRASRGHEEPYGVRFWCIGNEMGYGHMEGPNGAEGYAALAGKHVDAMLEKDPQLDLFSSGPYPNDTWAGKSAAVLADKVKYVSLHHYADAGKHFTDPESTKASYVAITESFTSFVERAERMRRSLDATGEKLHISFDEWNQWYSWFRPSSVAEGIFVARSLHFFMTRSNDLDMPIVCYFQPVAEGAIIITPKGCRLSANGQVYALMKAHQDGRLCKIGDNDDYSTVATRKDKELTITLINHSYDQPREFSFPLKGKVREAVLYSSEEVAPHSFFDSSPLEVTATRKNISTVLPPHSVALLKVDLNF